MEACPATCAECQHLACEGHVTWTPDAAKRFKGYTMDHGPGMRFEVDPETGGGKLFRRSKASLRWLEIATVTVFQPEDR